MDIVIIERSKGGSLNLKEPLNFQTPEHALKIAVQCVIIYFRNPDSAQEFLQKSYSKLAATEQLTRFQFNQLIAQVWTILIDNYLQSKDEKATVTKLMGLSNPSVPREFVVNVVDSINEERPLLEKEYKPRTSTRTTIARFSYKFDITLSGAKPILILHLTLSNGKQLTFRMPYQLFHRLRFSVARLLKEMQFLETRQIIMR